MGKADLLDPYLLEPLSVGQNWTYAHELPEPRTLYIGEERPSVSL